MARVYRAGGAHPVRWNQFREFGPVPTARFDPHPDPTRRDPRRHGGTPERVLYAATELRTCLAEVFQAARVIDRRTGAPHVAIWRPARTLRLLDLAGTWPTRAGASQAISSGPRARAREWARAIRVALPELDGLWYRSSMDSGRPALCLWTPATAALPSRPLSNLPLDTPALALPLARMARQIGYRLL